MERLAILPFENLTGDASLNWVATAAPLVVAADLSGAPKVFAQPMLSRSDAYLANSTRFVQGYFTGHAGSLRFQVEVEDASRHKMVADEAASGDLLASMNTLAKGLDSSAHSFSTSNTEAMAAWGHRDYEKAVTLDPDFGAAWFAWAETLVTRGESAQAADVAGRALKRPGLQSNVDRARLELLSATLRHDADARAKALTSLARLLRTDTPLLEALASAEMNARRFSTAVELFSNIVNVDPENAGDRNLLGYAQVYAGDFNAAAKTFEEYGKMPDQKTNSLDSLGEACFLTGRFKDAEKYFLQAYDSNHAFLAGTDLFKAAYAHWLGGDLKGADELMKRYLDTRRNDPLRAWREASWDYATGRRDQAVATLRKSPDAQIVDRQMAVRGRIPRRMWTR